MRNGIELISIERAEQIEKHGRTPERDVIENDGYQLRQAAQKIIDVPKVRYNGKPKGWDQYIWGKICDKDYVQRLTIAGALIAAEIDRVQNTPKI